MLCLVQLCSKDQITHNIAAVHDKTPTVAQDSIKSGGCVSQQVGRGKSPCLKSENKSLMPKLHESCLKEPLYHRLAHSGEILKAQVCADDTDALSRIIQ